MPFRVMFKGAVLGLAITACGCGTTGLVTRGQDPHAAAPGQFQTQATPTGMIRDHISGTQTTYYTDGNGVGERIRRASCQNQSCPPGGGSCPPSYGYGGSCPHGFHGGCPSCGLGRAPDWYPKHHFSYSYSVPNDLTYPQQNAVGGAIVYPYYTHRGPSDFFRQK